jgi:hypothetical protein
VEVIEGDTAMCVALMETPMEWQHGNMWCLTGRDLLGYDFISVERDSFVPIHVKSADIARLNDSVL